MEPHKGSQETYEYIGKFIAPDFFFSVNDVWHRMGMLGVFGDYVLSCTFGDVLEIGCGESSIYLAKIAKKYHRHIYHCDISPCKIENPLTIPGYMEPEIATFYKGASDDMFKELKISSLALVFIDGDHIFEQVKKDFFNVLPYVVDHGYILLHDTYPPDETYVDENRCGSVYQLRQAIEKDDRFDCLTLTRGTAMGVGLTIVRKKPSQRPYFNE